MKFRFLPEFRDFFCPGTSERIGSKLPDADCPQGTTSLAPTVTISGTEDNRAFTAKNGNLATEGITVTKGSANAFTKSVKADTVEADGTVDYEIYSSNNAAQAEQVYLLDTMPFDGQNGSTFAGTYHVTAWKLDTTLCDASKLRVYYTLDDQYRSATAATVPQATAQSWTPATIGPDGTFMDMNGQRPTAWAIIGTLDSNKAINIELQIQLEPDLSAFKDNTTYVNTISSGELRATAAAGVVKRSISGMAWSDDDADGRKNESADPNDTRCAGTTFYTGTGNQHDAILFLKKSLYENTAASDLKQLKVVMSGSPNSVDPIKLYFRMDGANWAEVNRFEINNGEKLSQTEKEYVFDLDASVNANWKGTITELRLDPLEGNSLSFNIKSITLVKADGSEQVLDFCIKEACENYVTFNSSVLPGVSYALNYTGGFDGNVVRLSAEDGSDTYYLETKADGFYIKGKDGNVTTKIADKSVIDENSSVQLRVIVDLDRGVSRTILNGKDCGTHPLLGSSFRLLSFETTDAGTCTTVVKGGYAEANYAIFEEFTFPTRAIPSDFTNDGALSLVGEYLRLAAGKKTACSFEPLSNKVCFTFSAKPEKNDQNTSWSLCAGDSAVVKLELRNGYLYANGQKIMKTKAQGVLTGTQEQLQNNMWHLIRVEADMATQKAVIKVHTKQVATVDFLTRTSYVDSVLFDNTASAGYVELDDIMVYNLADYDVPAPVVVEDNYNIGINVCSLWANGSHWGWATITPHDDLKPVLGYYDENLTETADWEIKYMTEHGIDFQAFCWYASSGNGALTPSAKHLNRAFVNAKYSDKMKFCLLWEAANGSFPTTVDAFKNYESISVSGSEDPDFCAGRHSDRLNVGADRLDRVRRGASDHPGVSGKQAAAETRSSLFL